MEGAQPDARRLSHLQSESKAAALAPVAERHTVDFDVHRIQALRRADELRQRYGQRGAMPHDRQDQRHKGLRARQHSTTFPRQERGETSQGAGEEILRRFCLATQINTKPNTQMENEPVKRTRTRRTNHRQACADVAHCIQNISFHVKPP